MFCEVVNSLMVVFFNDDKNMYDFGWYVGNKILIIDKVEFLVILAVNMELK